MNTKRLHFSATITALVTLVLSTGLVFAQPRKQMPHHEADPGARLERMVRFLELDESQEEELRSIYEAHRSTFEANREAGKANRTALKEALDSASPDPATVGQLVIDGKVLREQAEADREALQEQVATVLTEEQLAKWEGFQRGRHFDGRRGGKRGPRAGASGGASGSVD